MSIDKEKLQSLIYALRLDLEANSSIIECDEGSYKFVSMGAVNGTLSRLTRATEDEDFLARALEKLNN